MTNQNKPGYKHTPLGWIPQEWVIKEFGDVVLQSQYGLSVSSVDGGRYKIIGMKNIQDGKLTIENCATVSLSDEDYERYKLCKDDFLFNRTNSYDLVGKSVLVDENVDATFASYLVRFKLDKQKVLPKYIYYYFNTSKSDRKLKAIATKAVSQANINPTVLQKKFEILLPNIKEQYKIASILGAWDEAIIKTQQLITQLHHRNQGLMQELLNDKSGVLHFTLSDILLEKSVQVASDAALFDVLSVTKNGLVSQREYFNKDVASTDKSKYKIVNRGDVVMSGLNFWMGSIDMVVNFENGLVSPAYKVFQVASSKVSQRYIKHFVRSQQMLRILLSCSIMGASIVRRNFDREMFDNWLLKLPSLKEQEKIANLLDVALREVRLQEEKLQSLKKQKEGLMQKLLAGEIRVKI